MVILALSYILCAQLGGIHPTLSRSSLILCFITLVLEESFCSLFPSSFTPKILEHLEVIYVYLKAVDFLRRELLFFLNRKLFLQWHHA